MTVEKPGARVGPLAARSTSKGGTGSGNGGSGRCKREKHRGPEAERERESADGQGPKRQRQQQPEVVVAEGGGGGRRDDKWAATYHHRLLLFVEAQPTSQRECPRGPGLGPAGGSKSRQADAEREAGQRPSSSNPISSARVKKLAACGHERFAALRHYGLHITLARVKKKPCAARRLESWLEIGLFCLWCAWVRAAVRLPLRRRPTYAATATATVAAFCSICGGHTSTRLRQCTSCVRTKNRKRQTGR